MKEIKLKRIKIDTTQIPCHLINNFYHLSQTTHKTRPNTSGIPHHKPFKILALGVWGLPLHPKQQQSNPQST